eukprot:c18427_g1_i1 orf=193-1125(-)
MAQRVLLLLKRSAYDLYVNLHQHPPVTSLHRTVGNLYDRHKVHEGTIKVCKDILDSRDVQWRSLHRDELTETIKSLDLVITIGGDGTLLEAGHFLDGSIPILGVNSDPTQISEVEEKLHLYDASRSTGYLCAATKENFSQILDEILEGKRKPTELQRISTCIDGIECNSFALNDLLLAHPSPAAVTRLTFSIHKSCNFEHVSPMIHSRSSGLRVCTAVGSTAAMKSAGGYSMPLSSRDLQYMVREPIMPHPMHKDFMHGRVKADEILQVRWGSRQGHIYFDGSHLFHSLQFGSIIEISTKAPCLFVFLRT